MSVTPCEDHGLCHAHYGDASRPQQVVIDQSLRSSISRAAGAVFHGLNRVAQLTIFEKRKAKLTHAEGERMRPNPLMFFPFAPE